MDVPFPRLHETFPQAVDVTKDPSLNSRAPQLVRPVKLGGLLMLRMDDVDAQPSRREPLNVTAKP